MHAYCDVSQRCMLTHTALPDCRLHEFQAHELSDLLLGYASMVHHPGVLMPHMATAIKNSMDDMQGHALCCALWAMAVLRTLTPELFEEACGKLASRDLSEFEPQV